MLQSLNSASSGSLTMSNTCLSATPVNGSTPQTPTTPVSLAEEKAQRRRSTFYVPLLIENDDIYSAHSTNNSGTTPPPPAQVMVNGKTSWATDSLSTSSPGTQQPIRHSVSGSISSLLSYTNSPSVKFDSKNPNSKDTKTISSVINKRECKSNSNNHFTPPRSGTTSVKITTLLFERANSTLGFSTGSSTASSTSSGYRSGGSGTTSTNTKSVKNNLNAGGKSGNKSITTTVSNHGPGNTKSTTKKKSEEDVIKNAVCTASVINRNRSKSNVAKTAESIEALVGLEKSIGRNYTPAKRANTVLGGYTTTGPVINVSHNSIPTNPITARTTTNDRNSKNLTITSTSTSTSSSSSTLLSTSVPTVTSTSKLRVTNYNSSTAAARNKRYGLVLNHLNLDESYSPRSSLQILSGIISPENGNSPIQKMPPSPKCTASVTTTAPRTHFDDDDDIEVLPEKTIQSSGNGGTGTNLDQENTVSEVVASNKLNYSEEDDSEISHIQTNTSTPIKMMKCRSRTNILSVPSKGNVTVTNNNNSNSKTPTKSAGVLRIKSKTLPQNLSPTMVLQQGEALDSTHHRPLHQRQTSAIEQTMSPKGCNLNKRYSGSTATNLHHEMEKTGKGGGVKSLFLGNGFPTKNLFLLKSTARLTNSNNTNNNIISSKQTSMTSANSSCSSIDGKRSTLNPSPAPSTIIQQTSTISTSPKKSLSFIRRAHSTKLTRSNSLLKSVATQHQQHLQGVNGNVVGAARLESGSRSTSGSGIRSRKTLSSATSIASAASIVAVGTRRSESAKEQTCKDFLLKYEVCPLSLYDLDTYLHSDRCTELIRERFEIPNETEESLRTEDEMVDENNCDFYLKMSETRDDENWLGDDTDINMEEDGGSGNHSGKDHSVALLNFLETSCSLITLMYQQKRKRLHAVFKPMIVVIKRFRKL